MVGETVKGYMGAETIRLLRQICHDSRHTVGIIGVDPFLPKERLECLDEAHSKDLMSLSVETYPENPRLTPNCIFF